MQAAEQKTKELEEKGMWGRAAAAYSEMFGIVGSAVEVARIDKRRKDCLRQAGEGVTDADTKENNEQAVIMNRIIELVSSQDTPSRRWR